MQTYTRYAIYYAPPAGPLRDFAASWLGWDAAAGREVAHPALPGLPDTPAHLTAQPRRYGFHATIKPPFRLAEGCTAEALHDAAAAICARHAPVVLEGMRVARLGRFLALMPVGDTAALSGLAACLVEGLDAFRAPAAAAEIDRRRAAGLSTAQEFYLRRWGYPYVMEEFRFHMTLTGPLDEAQAGAVEAALAPALAPLLPRPYPIDALSLFGEDGEGRFHELHRYTLSGASAARKSESA